MELEVEDLLLVMRYWRVLIVLIPHQQMHRKLAIEEWIASQYEYPENSVILSL